MFSFAWQVFEARTRKLVWGLIQKVNSFKLSDSDVNLNVKWDDFLWENVIKELNHLFQLLTLVAKHLQPYFLSIDQIQNIGTIYVGITRVWHGSSTVWGMLDQRIAVWLMLNTNFQSNLTPKVIFFALTKLLMKAWWGGIPVIDYKFFTSFILVFFGNQK